MMTSLALIFFHFLEDLRRPGLLGLVDRNLTQESTTEGTAIVSVQNDCVTEYKANYIVERNSVQFVPFKTVMMEPSSVVMMCSLLRPGRAPAQTEVDIKIYPFLFAKTRRSFQPWAEFLLDWSLNLLRQSKISIYLTFNQF